MTYTFCRGSNNPFPQLPIIPHWGDLSYSFRLGVEWWVGDITYPAGFGLKLPAIGKFNYHRGGVGSSIIHEQGKVFYVPRYYENVSEGLNKNHELIQYRVELKPDIWYRVNISADQLVWLLDGKLLHSEPISLPSAWLTPIFIGKGSDNNYVVKFPRAGASKTLKIRIK